MENSLYDNLFSILMFMFGAVIGSFLACQAWRVRYKFENKKSLGKRSVCLSCGKQLKWYDNIPVISWLMLGGRCRYCGKKIGAMEILAEVGTGLAFLGLSRLATFSDLFLSTDAAIAFVLYLLIFSSLIFLAIYDGKWGELPNFALIISGVLAVVTAVVFRGFEDIWNTVGAVAILGLLYYILYIVSNGKWVGDGDWILGTIIGLILGDAWLALITLFIANLSGTLVMWPIVKNSKDKRIHFGPFLVFGFFVALLFGTFWHSLISF